jgi:GT2 family glycosyltransferase
MLLTDEVQLIMVTYHRPKELVQCVTSIQRNTPDPYHLSLIDNSGGALDNTLATFSNITIYHNPHNLGKGRGFMKWYDKIISRSDSNHFISIDPDLIVPPDWLRTLQITANRVRYTNKMGIIAPIIMKDKTDTTAIQLQRQQLTMHRRTPESAFVTPTLLRNRHTAGPLFLIDRDFFESVGGYSQTQLYGNDDGELCKAAMKQKRFVGITTDVEVLHLDNNDEGYKQWKKDNITGDVTGLGYYDSI